MKLKQIHQGFELYSRALIESKDVDPVYPFVKSIIEHFGFEPEWFIFCYQGFYNLESGIEMCKSMPTRKDWSKKKFGEMRENGKLSKFGHERRGTQRRVENQIEMYEAVVKWIDNWEEILVEADIHGADPTDANEFRKSIEAMPNFGSWSAYKIVELFEKSLGCDFLVIPDLGLEDKNFRRNDGPLGGLRWLFDKNRAEEETFDFGNDKEKWLGIFNEFGSRLSNAWGVDMGETETCLCKYHKLHTGKYFVGHDVAEFIHLRDYLGKKTFKDLMKKSELDKGLWDIKKFPKEKKLYYRDRGIIENEKYASKLPKIDTYKIMKQVLKDFGAKLPK